MGWKIYIVISIISLALSFGAIYIGAGLGVVLLLGGVGDYSKQLDIIIPLFLVFLYVFLAFVFNRIIKTNFLLSLLSCALPIVLYYGAAFLYLRLTSH